MRFQTKMILVTAQCLALFGCSAASGGLVLSGTGGTAGRGAAGGANTVGTADSLERCSRPLGTLAIADGEQGRWSSRYSAESGIPDIQSVLRGLAQKSNCFVVVAAGHSGQEAIIKEILAEERESGEVRAGSKLHKGQVVAADLLMYPSVIFPEQADAGVVSFGCGFLPGPAQAACRGVGVGRKSATMNLTLIDMRSRVQLASAEGSASGFDLQAALVGISPSYVGGLDAAIRTTKGKTSVAAFGDAHNQLVVALRNYRTQEVDGNLGGGSSLKVQGG